MDNKKRNGNIPKKEPDIEEEEYSDSFDTESTALYSECTGLTPSGIYDEHEAESYHELGGIPVVKNLPSKNGKSRKGK